MTRPPTVEQLLVLADRAERGRLSAAEASRLRAGIRAVVASQRGTSGRLAVANRGRRRSTAQMAAVRALVSSARQRGARTVPVWILAATLDDEPEIQTPAQPAPIATRTRAVG
ncbi:hypothetical protein [Streptomyces sp. NPDC059165]|uniref:hypothetical protein n=1 Tax=Streptomyces sp. NPDC059165 TaxID=3346751 RepID=UPI0036BFCB4A